MNAPLNIAENFTKLKPVVVKKAKSIVKNKASLQALDIAKVFTTGRSQAVRLPKAYRFNTKEVTIERRGDGIVLRPKVMQSKEEWWASMMAALNAFEGEDLIIPGRDRTGMRTPVSFDDV